MKALTPERRAEGEALARKLYKDRIYNMRFPIHTVPKWTDAQLAWWLSLWNYWLREQDGGWVFVEWGDLETEYRRKPLTDALRAEGGTYTERFGSEADREQSI